MADLDTILAGEGASAPEPTPAASPAEPPSEPAAQPRDDRGRFAGGKDGGSPEEPVSPEPKDGKKQTDAQPHQAPVAAVTAERAKRQSAEQRLEQLEAELKELRRQPAPKPQAPAVPETPPDWFANPDDAFTHRFRQATDPIQQSLMYNARLIAEQINGADTVANAVEAFDNAVAAGKVDQAERRRIMTSANPFHDAVHWQKRQQTLAEVGEDPAAYRERIRAEVLAELQAGGKTPATKKADEPAQAPPVMPSNLAGARSVGARSRSAWGGPVTLKDIFDRRPGK